MRKTLLGFVCLASLMVSHCKALFSIEIDEITAIYLYENPCTDHIQHFQKFFKDVKVDSFLEFGLSHGTTSLFKKIFF